MCNINCEIINDIMPLYVEEMVSDSTKIMVEEHITECSECRNKLKEMQKKINIPVDNIIVPMTSLKKKLFRKKLVIIILSIIVALTLGIIGLIYLTAPIPLKYDKSLISIEKLDDERVLVTISKEVNGYSIEGYKLDTDTSVIENNKSAEYVYHITLWNSLWNEYIKKGKERSIIINKNDDDRYHDVKAIYYYSGNIETNSNSEDFLIYGQDMYESGGIVTLPRLVLTYYFIIAFIIALVGNVIYLISKKYVRIRKITVKIILLSVSYMISQLCVKGFKFSSYYLVKDLSGILLLMFPIFGILIIIRKLIYSEK